MRFIPVLIALLPAAATADILITFTEGAPKDRFTLENLGCDLGQVDLTINLATAPAGLIFDVTGRGAGVEVFQPVEVVAGTVTFSDVTDGDQVLNLSLFDFKSGDTAAISADLDDTQAAGALGQIRVAGSEIAGASVASEGGEVGIFQTDATARLPMPGCLG